MTPKLADLRKQRAAAFDAFKVLAEQPTLSEAEQVDYTDKEAAVRAFDEQIARAKAAQDLAGAAAEPATPRKHHDPCQRCHTKDIEENCDTCHDKAEKPGFQHKWPLGDQHKDLSCRECHPKGKPIGKLDTSCGSCHEDPRHDDKQPPKNRTGATPHAGATAGKGA